MTNGEKLISDFPYIRIKGQDEVFTTIQIDTTGTGTPIIVYTEWWNAEYKEPTTKNDLEVDAVSRQAVLDIAKASKSNWIDNSILFKRVNELPTVTPQEPKIKVLERDEAMKKLGAVDIYQASAWITLLNDLEYLGLKICEVKGATK